MTKTACDAYIMMSEDMMSWDEWCKVQGLKEDYNAYGMQLEHCWGWDDGPALCVIRAHESGCAGYHILRSVVSIAQHLYDAGSPFCHDVSAVPASMVDAVYARLRSTRTAVEGEGVGRRTKSAATRGTN